MIPLLALALPQVIPLLALALPQDITGAPIAPQAHPRIVSVAPALTETAYAIGAGSAMVGASDYCNYPAKAKALPRIGSLNTLNVEKIVALRPTLIMSAPGPRDQWMSLQRITRAPVFISADGGIDAIKRNALALGVITRHEKGANALTRAIDDQIKALRVHNRGRKPPKVFFMVWDDPLQTAGRGSYLDDLITGAGGQNLGHELSGYYPRMSWERLLADPPDVMLGPANLQASIEAAGKKVRARHTALLDPDIVSRPGPRVVEALKLLHRAIFPPPQKIQP